jgi:hypothetical protein
MSRSEIKRWGVEFAVQFNVDLGCSEGWLEKFLARHNLTLRRISTKWSMPFDEIDGDAIVSGN